MDFYTSVNCHVFIILAHFYYKSFLSFQVFAFEGQTIKLNVNIMLICTPGLAVIRTVCKYSGQILVTDIIFVLQRFSSETP